MNTSTRHSTSTNIVSGPPEVLFSTYIPEPFSTSHNFICKGSGSVILRTTPIHSITIKVRVLIIVRYQR